MELRRYVKVMHLKLQKRVTKNPPRTSLNRHNASLQIQEIYSDHIPSFNLWANWSVASEVRLDYMMRNIVERNSAASYDLGINRGAVGEGPVLSKIRGR